ncbi:hypothetical protein OIE13_05900 [Streptosporangium sp. NBC_01810]|uniref:hypothetical protein n=1 Tax=Streptosporangium sp. NBC_01810 TaxID=2975951 RepID=UPI002DDACAE7|nr:hypothetical protein [Streptosporangium sp. NBC_01810]WSA27406.1 hypothetical protein OIE13_05900 [Streptosporangium sp. NBC_01810]
MRDFVTRQPIVIRVIIAIAIVAILRITALLGWIPANWVIAEDAVQDWIDYAIGLGAFWSARRAVTPVADPRDDQGRALVPASPRPYPMG